MRVVFFGTPEFAVPSLEGVATSRHRIELVVSRPDKPVGRRQNVQSPPVALSARRLHLPLIQPRKLKTPDLESQLRATELDAAVVVAYGRFIPAHLVEIPRFGFVNLHPSLLPRHRGPSPIQWAIACGDRATGVTTMLIDEEMDAGPLLLQRRVSIGRSETAGELARRLAEVGADLVVATLDGLEDGSIEPRPQPEEGVTVTRLLRRGMGEVDWGEPAQRLAERLRGFTPWPGLFTTFRGKRLKLHRLEPVPRPPVAEARPGTVLEVSPSGIVVECGDGTAARLLELQLEGRRRLAVGDFLAGERVEPGERFE